MNSFFSKLIEKSFGTAFNRIESVLALLLFVIFINDIVDIVHRIIKLFANDSKPLATIRNKGDLVAYAFYYEKVQDAVVN